MSSFYRKLERNKLKYDIGTNKIQKSWRRKKINEYGIQGYIDLQRKNKKKVTTKNIF